MTAASLVRPDSSFLDEPGRLAQLVEFRRWLQREGSVNDGVDAAEQADRLAKWVRIAKQANKIAVEALRVEAVALRLVANHDAVRLLPPHRRAVARVLNDLTQPEFDKLITAIPDTWRQGLPAWVKQHASDKYRSSIERQDWADFCQVGDGHTLPRSPRIPEPKPSRRHNIEWAAQELLVSLLARGESFTTDEAARLLAQRLELPSDDPLLLDGCRFLVREAVREANDSDPGTGTGVNGDGVPGVYSVNGDRVMLPSLVTYFDNRLHDRWHNERNGSFIRVPVLKASLDQFAAMASYRQKQADELQATADALSRMVELLRKEESDVATNAAGSVWDRFQSAWPLLDPWIEQTNP